MEVFKSKMSQLYKKKQKKKQHICVCVILNLCNCAIKFCNVFVIELNFVSSTTFVHVILFSKIIAEECQITVRTQSNLCCLNIHSENSYQKSLFTIKNILYMV